MTSDHPDIPEQRTAELVVWLIEVVPSQGAVRYYCGPGEWCDNPNHAKKFPTEKLARRTSYDLKTMDPLRVVEHSWTRA